MYQISIVLRSLLQLFVLSNIPEGCKSPIRAVRTLPVANHYTRYKVVVAIKYSIIYYLTVLNLGCLKSDY